MSTKPNTKQSQEGDDVLIEKNALLAKIKTLEWELLMVSKLAADKPMFFNPINAGLAKNIRDRVLSSS